MNTCFPPAGYSLEFSSACLCCWQGLGFRSVAPRLSPSPGSRGAWTSTLTCPVSPRKDTLPARTADTWSSRADQTTGLRCFTPRPRRPVHKTERRGRRPACSRSADGWRWGPALVPHLGGSARIRVENHPSRQLSVPPRLCLRLASWLGSLLSPSLLLPPQRLVFCLGLFGCFRRASVCACVCAGPVCHWRGRRFGGWLSGQLSLAVLRARTPPCFPRQPWELEARVGQARPAGLRSRSSQELEC